VRPHSGLAHATNPRYGAISSWGTWGSQPGGARPWMDSGSTRWRGNWRRGNRGAGRCAGWLVSRGRCWLSEFRSGAGPGSTVPISGAAAPLALYIPATMGWSAVRRHRARRAGPGFARIPVIVMRRARDRAGTARIRAIGETRAPSAVRAIAGIWGDARDDGGASAGRGTALSALDHAAPSGKEPEGPWGLVTGAVIVRGAEEDDAWSRTDLMP
jgi:hypothetical protein